MVNRHNALAHPVGGYQPRVKLPPVIYSPEDVFWRVTYKLEGYECFARILAPTREAVFERFMRHVSRGDDLKIERE